MIGFFINLIRPEISFSKCVLCKGRTENMKKYCHQCAFVKGICEMCGKKVHDVKMYKQADLDKKYKRRIDQIKDFKKMEK